MISLMRGLARGPSRAVVAALLAAATVAACTVPTLSSSPSASASPETVRPNVVYILVDDMRTDEMRFLPRTRRLIAAQGMDLTGAIAPHPLCCPARAQILTGQYGQNNGVRHNNGAHGGYKALKDPKQTLGVWAQRAGYRTALHGKYLNGYERLGNQRKQPGWDRWDALTYGTYDYVDFGFADGDSYRDDYVTTRLTQRAVSSIERFSAREAPFLVMVSHPAPHTRILVPRHRSDSRFPLGDPSRKAGDPGAPAAMKDPAFNEMPKGMPADLRNDARKVSKRYVRRLHAGRAAALEAVDRSVARTVRALRRAGVLDETVLVFASDNGFLLGEHRLMTKNYLFDEALSVPMLVRGPGVVRGEHDRLVTLVDLTTTLVGMMGLRPTVLQDGEDLTALLAGGEHLGRDTTLVQTGAATVRGARHPGWAYRGVKTDRYVYARNVNAPENELLFDHVRDPEELENLAARPEYAQVRQALARRARELQRCAGSACNRTFGPLPAPISMSE